MADRASPRCEWCLHFILLCTRRVRPARSTRRASFAAASEGACMSAIPILRLGSVKNVARFKEHLRALGLDIPCDDELIVGPISPLRKPLSCDDLTIGNRICVQPMEGWDGTADGRPTENTFRRWQRFGQSGGK